MLILFATFAALPPMAQSSREIQSILSDARLQQALGSASSIESIERKEESYLISTTRQAIWVEVVYKSSNRPGPIPFDLVFHEPEQLR